MGSNPRRPPILWLGLFVVVLIAGVTTAAATVIVQIDVSQADPLTQQVVSAVTVLVVSQPGALILGYLRHIFGYGNAFLRAYRKKEEIEYSATYMLQTLTRFEGVTLGAMTFIDQIVMNLPPEQKIIAATATSSLWLLIEWIFSEAKSLSAAILKPG
jgi:hypothetical protein